MRKLKIRTHGMFGANHSWAHTMRSIFLEFHKMGHELSITSTDGFDFFPKELLQYKDVVFDSPDIDICYTLPNNFRDRFVLKSKLKLAIFNYESSVVPIEWKKSLDYIDFVLPSSNFVSHIFKNNGWNDNKIKTLHLGVDWEQFSLATPQNIPGLNKYVFLNISIPHFRKNIDLTLESYYKSFSANDDVSLIIKTSLKKPSKRFECDVVDIIKNAQKKAGKSSLPKVHVITDNYLNIAPLYKASNCLFSMSAFEGFGLPMLEAVASGIDVIAPKSTGQIDFLNEENSYLINCSEINAPEQYQYWRSSQNSKIYQPSIDEASFFMKNVIDKKSKNTSISDKIINDFSWKTTANNILKIYDNF